MIGSVAAQTAAGRPGAAALERRHWCVKGKAPVSNDILKVTLPKPQEADLPNGLHLMVLEDHRLPRVAFQIIIPGAGGYFDPPAMIGLSTYTAQMMREGTTTKTSQQISQELETMAATVTVGGSTSGPFATVSGGALTENMPKLFELTADVLLNPSFPADEWARLKTRTQTGLIQQRTQPGFLSAERFSKVIFGDHPAGRVSATPETLDAITRDAMVEFHSTRFVPDNALIAFAGDISLADARKMVGGEARRRGRRPARQSRQTTQPPAPGPPKVYLVARPNSVQTSLAVGTQSMVRTDPDYVPLTVANRVLGGTMGRLFRHLREEKGYTYGIGSGFSATDIRGQWSASTSVRTEVTEAGADRPARRDCRDARQAGAGERADGRQARDRRAASRCRSRTRRRCSNYYVQNWLYRLPADYWDTYPAKINAVTAAQAQAAAAKYWDPAKLQIVAVGDASKVTDILKEKGTLEVYDAEGKPAEVREFKG